MPNFSKFVISRPGNGNRYYALDIPLNVRPPRVGESMALGDAKVKVESVMTPDDIAKGRGGPVAKAMRKNGIGWRVNCLSKRSPEEATIFKFAGKLQKVIDQAKKQDDLPSVFLGGACDDNNAWRKNIKKDFEGDFFFVDPYDPDWEAEDNIYEELAALLNVDHVIFFNGGDGTKKEKIFMNNADRDYKEFKDLQELKDYLSSISSHTAKTACIANYLRRLAALSVFAS